MQDARGPLLEADTPPSKHCRRQVRVIGAAPFLSGMVTPWLQHQPLQKCHAGTHASHLPTHLRFSFFVFLQDLSFFLILHLCDVLSLCFAEQARPLSSLPSPLHV